MSDNNSYPKGIDESRHKLEESRKVLEKFRKKIQRLFPTYDVFFSPSAATYVLEGYHPITGTYVCHYLLKELVSQRTVDHLGVDFNITNIPTEMAEYVITETVHMLHSHADRIEKIWDEYKNLSSPTTIPKEEEI